MLQRKYILKAQSSSQVHPLRSILTMCSKTHGRPILLPFIDLKLLNFHALDRRCTLILTRSKRMRRPSTDMMRSAKACLRVKDWHMCETFGHLSQLFPRAKTVSYAKQHIDEHINHKLHCLVSVSSKVWREFCKYLLTLWHAKLQFHSAQCHWNETTGQLLLEGLVRTVHSALIFKCSLTQQQERRSACRWNVC